MTSVDSDEPVQPPFKLRNSKWCSISSLIFREYSSYWQRLSSDCAYAQADLRLCWSHIPHRLKSHITAQLYTQIIGSRALISFMFFIQSIPKLRYRPKHLERSMCRGQISNSEICCTPQEDKSWLLFSVRDMSGGLRNPCFTKFSVVNFL